MNLLSRIPLHPLLFAAYSVLFVYAANLSEVLPVDLIAPLGRAVIVAGAVTAFGMLAFRNAGAGGLVATATVIAFAFFGHLAPNLAQAGLDERGQLAFWAGVVVLAALAGLVARGRLPTITLGLNTVALVLVAMALATIVPYEMGRAARVSATPAPTGDLIAEATRLPERDIYYLVFDRYGSDWSLEHRFGVDSDLPEWLAEQGFQVVPGARANYRATDFSLAATLNMRYLDELTETVGRESDDRTPARALIGPHALGTFLRAHGYRYFHLGSWYGPTAGSPIADEVLTEAADTEFESVLHDTSIRPAIDRLSADPSDEETAEPTFRERHRDIALYQLRQLQRMPAEPGRKFVFAHLVLPHPPYVFHADGSTVLESEVESRSEADLFAEQLAYTNSRIRQTVEALLAGPPEEDPIVVIQADEGPFLCGDTDCVNLEPETLGIRFGILGAYYLPDMPVDVLPPDHSAVNTFRLILREYFGADLERLPDRSFTWPDNEHLYDFRDITDLLPLPGSSP